MSTIGGANIVREGLVLYLDAANQKSYLSGSTVWRDLSLNNNSGSLVNGPTFDSNNAGSIVFDGIDDYVTNVYLPSGTNPFTYSSWFYLSQNINGNFGTYKAAVLFSGNFPQKAEIYLLTSGSIASTPATFQFGVYGNAGAGVCIISVANLIDIQKWYNICLSHTGTSQIAYLNGSQIGTGTLSYNFQTGNSYIGAAPYTPSYAGYINGKISSTQIYNRALSSEEVLQNYEALKSRYI